MDTIIQNFDIVFILPFIVILITHKILMIWKVAKILSYNIVRYTFLIVQLQRLSHNPTK